VEDSELKQAVKEFIAMNEKPIACKYFEEKENTEKSTAELGIKVEYVGEQISKLIKDGYLPIVW
jgi:hypothetical protein